MASPAVSGLLPSQTQSDAVTKNLFSTISVTDPGNVSVIITLTNNGTATDADGLLSGSGLTKTGVGTYRLSSDTPANITTELKALVFTPTAHQVDVGSKVVTGISLVATDTSTSGNTPVAATDTVTAVNTAPTVLNVSSHDINDESATAPFAGVTITDPDKNASTSATITLTAAGVATDANGLLTGVGLTKSAGVGTYTVSATTPASLSAELAALRFTPTAHHVAPGDTLDTIVNLAVAERTAVTSGSTTIHVTAVTDSPVIDGAVTTDQPTTDRAAITPFSAVTITDVDFDQTETVTVGLSDPTNGSLSDPNAATDGGVYDSAAGVYTVTGSASQVSAALDSLVFTPTIHQVTPGQAVTTVLTITDTNTAGNAVSDSSITVVATAQDTGPTITGLPANESGFDNTPITPFGGATVTDPDFDAATSAIITLTNSGGAATDADGILSGNGLTKTGAGSYSLDATTPTNLETELRALSFAPTGQQVAPGQTVDTLFNLVVSDGTATAPAGTSITVIGTPCYCRGTLILTDTGEVAVEDLRIGDRLITKAGNAKPIHWIGRRSYSGRFIAGNRDVLPVLIKQGALADNVPRRDLLVSPLHAMFLDGVLIPALALVNEVSILQAETVETVEYFHLELEAHDVIHAEGALSETFVDDDSRGMFHNVAEYHTRYPRSPRTPARYCAPRVEDGEELEVVRHRLAARTQALVTEATQAPAGRLRSNLETVQRGHLGGWAHDDAAPDSPVLLRILDNGVTIGQVLANTYRKDIEQAGIGGGNRSFTMVVLGGLSPDQRHVIQVKRMSDGRDLRGSPWVFEACVEPLRHAG